MLDRLFIRDTSPDLDVRVLRPVTRTLAMSISRVFFDHHLELDGVIMHTGEVIWRD